MRAMPITDYFLAPDDSAAVRVLETFGPERAGLPSLPSKGLDPEVNLGFLESYLTGRSYDEVTEAPEHARIVAGAESMVVAVSDALLAALVAASEEQVVDAAERWSETEELEDTEPEGLADFIRELAGLARQAGDQHLYCYWAL
jgi:hypothetical protein